MEVIKMKCELVSEEEDILLGIKVMKNEDKPFTFISSEDKPFTFISVEADSIEENSLLTSVVKEEQKESYDEATDKTENVFIRVKNELPDGLSQDTKTNVDNCCGSHFTGYVLKQEDAVKGANTSSKPNNDI
ncbi:uncharacterized protein LOC143242641 isoform X2 [Tachypleus tridentatus]